MNKLDFMFEMQESLNNTIATKRNIEWLKSKNRINTKEFGSERLAHDGLLEVLHAMQSELSEYQNGLDYKWWTNEKVIDRDYLIEELVDLWHFMMTALLILGCDSERFFNTYLDKNKENHNRQEGLTERKGYNAEINEKYEGVD